MSCDNDFTGPLILADITEWRSWLVSNESTCDGIWLVLAKKGVTNPTSLTYQEALEEALCSGWIDGRRKTVDADTFQQRFTPRRTRSIWSQRNVEIVGRLLHEGRLRPRGAVEIERAKADGRWERAYPGQASAEIPADLRNALSAAPAAQTGFSRLSRADRYTALHPILTAPNPAARARRVTSLIARLNGFGPTETTGETLSPGHEADRGQQDSTQEHPAEREPSHPTDKGPGGG